MHECRRQDRESIPTAARPGAEKADVGALLAEQIAYYRARAPEYDFAYPLSVEPAFGCVIDRFCPAGDVLELACGTGHWTPRLLRHARMVTAVDASAEMLAIARARLRRRVIRFVQADIFAWEPDRRYDVVFFAFWLSHVPRARFDVFWSVVASALKPGGRVLFLDDIQQRETHTAAGPTAETVARLLKNGRNYRVIKVGYQPAELTAELARVGWRARVAPLSEHFYWGEAARPEPDTHLPDPGAGASWRA